MDYMKGDIAFLNDGLYEYLIPLKEPSDEKDIINHEYNKRTDQYWHVPVIPDVRRMSQSERIRFIERERQRWEEGVFIIINGELTYLTGMHYDHLMYMTFKDAKAEYFDHQRYDFYFRDLCRRDVKCRGMCWLKPRRYGATMQEITQATYTLLENFSNNVGLQSDADDKVGTTLLTPIIQSYVNRPKFMRSDYSKPNGKLLISKLVLNSNLAPKEDDAGYIIKAGNYLGGWLKGFPTVVKAMDGNEMAYIINDEFFKLTTASPLEVFGSNKMVIKGRKRTGRISVLSTMGDSNNCLRAVMEGIDLIKKSNPIQRDENGNTLSGLYKRFVDATFSFEIDEDIFETDAFGKVNTDKHREWIINKLKSIPKDTPEWVFENRRLPLKEGDALMSAAAISYFSKIRTSQRYDQLRDLAVIRKSPYVKGMLDTSFSGKVGFDADENGIWQIAIHPYWNANKNIDTRNRFQNKRNVFYPPPNPEFFASLDPVRYEREDTTSTHLSRFCGLFHKKFDYFGSGIYNQYAAMLLYRPDDPRDGNREMIKGCKYFGSPCMYERNITSPKEDFRDANMLPFLVKDIKDGIHGMLMKSNRRNTQDGIDMLRTRFGQVKHEDELDQIMLIPFEEMLLDMDNFDIANTTAFDVMMAMILLEHCMKQFPFSNVSDNSANNILSAMQELFPERN